MNNEKRTKNKTLNIFLGALPGLNYEYSSINNLIEEEQLPYGQEYLSLLARQGKIDAYKEGNVWYTSKRAVSNYMENRKRKRSWVYMVLNGRLKVGHLFFQFCWDIRFQIQILCIL